MTITRLMIVAILLFSTVASANITIEKSNAASGPASTTPFSQGQRKAIDQYIHEYIMHNPQVMIDSLRSMQQREQQQAVQRSQQLVLQNTRALFHDKNSPVIGNRSGSVAVVEFFDYQCPHCKMMASSVEELLYSNTNLKVILKLYPILGKKSDYAAQAALAAMKQGKFKVFHFALLKSDQPLTRDNVLAIAQRVNINIKRLKRDMKNKTIQQELKNNAELADELGLIGTPAYIVADSHLGSSKQKTAKLFFVPGATTRPKLQQMISIAGGALNQ